MLSTRLMLGLMCLMIIVLAMGLYSMNQCNELGRRIQSFALENDGTGRNVQEMKRACTAMTTALLCLTTGDTARCQTDFQTASGDFRMALDRQRTRATQDKDEKEATDKVNGAFEDYDQRAQAFIHLPDQNAPNWKSSAGKLGDDTTKLLVLVDGLAKAHEHAMTEGQHSSASDVIKTVRLLWFIILVAFAVTIMAYIGLNRGLLSPLRNLTASIKQIGQGNLEQNVPVVSKDELGVLAVSFNQMAAQLRQYQANTSVELLRLNETIRATLASFPDPVFVLNSEGAVEFRNPAADSLAVKLLFSGVLRLPEVVDEKVEEVRASGNDYLPTAFAEAIKFRVDGQDIYYLPRIVILRTEKGETFGVAVILDNVTRMLLLDDVKSNLIATVSHELKTPLTSVRMALYLLYEKTVGEINDKQFELVTAAKDDADRLLRTLNDLLDLAKLEHGPTQLQFRVISPESLIDNAQRAARDIAAAANIQCRTEIAPGLPKVQVDAQRIAYVFANLVGNAIKYSPGGSTITLRAEPGQTRAARPSVRFSVKDEGPGVTPEYQEHIFERFYRVPGTNKNGAGLGLSIAREIVIAHGGEIGVLSEHEKGSEFFFILPVAALTS
jgi:signal transduction histidine kinase